MKKNKSFFIGLIILFCCLTFSVGFEIAYSDSGWDSSYDGGGYDYDYGGGYDYDYDYDYDGSSYNSSGGHSHTSSETLIIALFITIVLFFIISYMKKSESYKQTQRKAIPSKTEHPEYYLEDFQDLNKYLPNMTINDLKHELYGKFIDIQNAWMEFNYDKRR